jgi:hypothetical protein
MILQSWFAARARPVNDEFFTRFYKNMAGASMANAFVLVFCLLAYPNFARKTTRLNISTLLTKFNSLFADSMLKVVIPATTGLGKINISTAETLKKETRLMDAQIHAMQPLLIFSVAEFRVDGRFDAEAYKAILTHTTNLLSHLENSNLYLLGSTPSSPSRSSTSPEIEIDTLISQWRLATEIPARNLRETVRMLLFMYSTSLIAKSPLPYEVPNVRVVWEKCQKEFEAAMEGLVSVVFSGGEANESFSEGSEYTSVDLTQVTSTTTTQIQMESASQRATSSTPSSAFSFTPTLSGTPVPQIESSTSLATLVSKPLNRKSNILNLNSHSSVIYSLDSERVESLLKSESWSRFLAYTFSVKLFAEEMDALEPWFKRLFKEMPEVNPFELKAETTYFSV